ncbi:MAG: restriction endonuclease subunit S [Winogradskyella arenosi]
MMKVELYPKNWDVVNIEDIADVKGGKRLPKGESLIEEITNHPYIRVADMFMGGVKTGKILYVPEDVYPSISRYTISKDDLFISVAGTLGIVGGIPEELDGANLTENADKLTNIKIDKEFLRQVLLSPIIQNAVEKEKTNNAQPKLALSRIRTFKIPNPPLPEQQKIADILSTVDAKIEVIDQQITETQDLKKGLMQRLLTKGIGHTEFKDSALGDIPKSWEVLELVKHIKLLSGFAFKSKDFNEEGKGVKLLRGINITIGKLRWNEKIDRWWDLDFDDFEKYSAKVGDLVISMDGSLVGRNYARVQEKDLPLLIVQRVACLRAKLTLDLEFLNQIIGSPLWLNYVDSVKTSSGIPHISAKNIREFKIPFPPKEEQEQIAKILSSVDNKLEVLSEKKTTYQELKKGLMQQLLTGKIRVKV